MVFRFWGIWTIQPDGRNWAPLVSAFHGAHAFHFMTQLGSGDIVVEDYYNLNNNGFGAFFRLPAGPPAGSPAFHSETELCSVRQNKASADGIRPTMRFGIVICASIRFLEAPTVKQVAQNRMLTITHTMALRQIRPANADTE